jgi:hypothetical protein
MCWQNITEWLQDSKGIYKYINLVVCVVEVKSECKVGAFVNVRYRFNLV